MTGGRRAATAAVTWTRAAPTVGRVLRRAAKQPVQAAVRSPTAATACSSAGRAPLRKPATAATSANVRRRPVLRSVCNAARQKTVAAIPSTAAPALAARPATLANAFALQRRALRKVGPAAVRSMTVAAINWIAGRARARRRASITPAKRACSSAAPAARAVTPLMAESPMRYADLRPSAASTSRPFACSPERLGIRGAPCNAHPAFTLPPISPTAHVHRPSPSAWRIDEHVSNPLARRTRRGRVVGFVAAHADDRVSRAVTLDKMDRAWGGVRS